MNENLLTIEQAAERLSIGLSTLRGLVREGKIKVIRISTRGDMRFDPKDIQTFIEENKG